MQIQLTKPQFIRVERIGDREMLYVYIFRIDQIDYINVTESTIHFLDKSQVRRVTQKSMEELQEILLNSHEPKHEESPIIQF